MKAVRSPIVDLRTHPSRYVTLDQLALYFSMSRRSLYNYIEKGALKARKIGSSIRVHVDDARSFAGEKDPPIHSKSA